MLIATPTAMIMVSAPNLTLSRACAAVCSNSGPNSAEPTDERDLAVGPNPQGARNTFANMTVDFGFHQPTCLGNFIWLDADADGLQSPDEKWLGGVTISLFKDDVLVATTISNVFGEYGFYGLTPVTTLSSLLPVGYDATLGEQGNNDAWTATSIRSTSVRLCWDCAT